MIRLDPQHHDRLEHVLPEEFLHSLRSPGVPDHMLNLEGELSVSRDAQHLCPRLRLEHHQINFAGS